MEVTIRHARQLAPDVWEVTVEPGELTLFGTPLQQSGPTSVIQVTGDLATDEHATALRFDHRTAHVLNHGQSERAIVIANIPTTKKEPPMEATSSGDQRFLAALAADPELHRIGSKLLAGVRAKSAGRLTYYETSGRYVDTPDNFWTVKIQPRDRSLRITVRGTPKQLPNPPELTITPDRASYSTLKITSVAQVNAATLVILRARRKT